MSEFISLDLPALLAATTASLACALLGNYLVLRKLSLMGDAISHSVLPGIVIAFLITSSRSITVVFIGAALAGVISAILIELVRRYGRVESGASMGVVFSIFFAFGVLLIEQAAARNMDLDADCLLHGQLESIFWYPPTSPQLFFSFDTLKLIPHEVFVSFATLLIVLAFIFVLYKELKISSFDPDLATALGFSSNLMHQLLMVLVACAVVASFKVVGSILVIAMLICPAAIARLYTDKLKIQIYLSAGFALFATISGYFAGAFGPQLFGHPHSLSAAGMIAVALGVILGISVIVAPQYGILPRHIRRKRLALKVRADDILAELFRAEEQQREITASEVREYFLGTSGTLRSIEQLIGDGLVTKKSELLSLTSSGRERAKAIVRSHRLWETFLVEEAEFDGAHVHETAEKLEHFAREKLEQSFQEEKLPTLDPHGKKIPS